MNELLRELLFLPRQASTVARSLDALHYFIILTTMAGAAVVTLFGGYFIVRYRRGHYGGGEDEYAASRMSRPAPIPLSLEVGVIGGLLALFLLWWWLGFRQFVHLRVAPENAQEVYVVAKKWMWSFAYPEGGGSLSVLYVPANRPIKLIISSRDVIHSFFVPEFRIKQDAVPGRYTTAWFEAVAPGTYEILCTEYCGTGHSTMRGQVVALSPADYERWLEGGERAALAGPLDVEPASPGDQVPRQPLRLVDLGERIAAQQGCLRCHSPDGTPHIGPTWAGLFGSQVPQRDGATVTADEAFLTESMMDPQRRIHRGFEPVMPTYLGLLQPGETAALVEYIKSLRHVTPQPTGR